MEKSYVLITGASSGIGASCSRRFAMLGYNLVLLARREDKLKKVKEGCLKENNNINIFTFKCDVKNKDDLEYVSSELKAKDLEIKFVFANAGFGVMGKVERLCVDDFKNQFETNVFGVLNTFYAFFEFLKITRGTFAITGSISGHVSFPSAAAYSMSKYCVRSLAETLYLELIAHSISVTLISPGFVESEIRKVNNKGVLKEAAEDVAPSFLVMPTDVAAKKIVNGIIKGKREVVLTMHAKIILLMNRYFRSILFFSMQLAARLKISRLQ